MATKGIKIKDLPILYSLLGTEVIPCGGRGNYGFSINTLIEKIKSGYEDYVTNKLTTVVGGNTLLKHKDILIDASNSTSDEITLTLDGEYYSYRFYNETQGTYSESLKVSLYSPKDGVFNLILDTKDVKNITINGIDNVFNNNVVNTTNTIFHINYTKIGSFEQVVVDTKPITKKTIISCDGALSTVIFERIYGEMEGEIFTASLPAHDIKDKTVTFMYGNYLDSQLNNVYKNDSNIFIKSSIYFSTSLNKYFWIITSSDGVCRIEDLYSSGWVVSDINTNPCVTKDSSSGTDKYNICLNKTKPDNYQDAVDNFSIDLAISSDDYETYKDSKNTTYEFSCVYDGNTFNFSGSLNLTTGELTYSKNPINNFEVSTLKIDDSSSEINYTIHFKNNENIYWYLKDISFKIYSDTNQQSIIPSTTKISEGNENKTLNLSLDNSSVVVLGSN